MQGLTVKQMTGTSYNLSYYLILPMMPGEGEYYLHHYLTQTYMFKDSQYCICLEYNPDPNDIIFPKLRTAFSQFRNFISEEIVDDRYLFSFRIPKPYKKDFELILEGKYSKIADTYKRRILKFHSLTNTSGIGTVIYRSKRRLEYLEDLLAAEIPEDIDLFDKINLTKESWINTSELLKTAMHEEPR